ncbi:hypothetical protein niasHT_022452 [Heterodera trifolii]|uniref:MULE transposase domain-containing protein n=1 Tax=Heterodera trifolii TaxID=157864 RepID=A0ABD2K9D5_9BILA
MPSSALRLCAVRCPSKCPSVIMSKRRNQILTHREQNDENNDCDDEIEEEQAIVNFELGKTQKGGICLWSEGFRLRTNKMICGGGNVRDCLARVTITDKSDNGMAGYFGQKAEIRRQKILECVKAEPRIKPTRLLAEVRRSTADETYVAMGSDNALSCMMRRQKRKILGNVDCTDPLAFVIPDKLRLKNGEDIVLYDSRTVRIGEKDVVLVFGNFGHFEQNNATWHLDGTFKAAPSIWEQCFVVGASVNHRMCIGVWGLLPGKHRRYYEEVLNFLRSRILPVAPRKVICDFEKAEMNAVSAVFPTTNILCCMFHYGQNLFRKMKGLKLVQMYGEQSLSGEAVRHSFRNVLSLPLLPPTYVRRAFSVIVGTAPMEMEQFLLYFARTYIGMTQQQLLDGDNAFGVRPGGLSPFSSFAGTSFSSVESDHAYSRQPLQFGIDSPAPSTLSWPSTVEQNSPLPVLGKNPSSVAHYFQFHIGTCIHMRPSALARTNNGLEATHLHFSKGLCHHPALSDFIYEVSRSIDKQVDAARSARNFVHKRHKRYVLQDAVIMRILADATYNNDTEIQPLPNKVIGFNGRIKIIYIDQNVLIFLSHFHPFFAAAYTVYMDIISEDIRILEFLLLNIWPMFRDSICWISLNAITFRRMCQLAPTMLTDCPALRYVESDDAIFPEFLLPDDNANATDGETVAKWLFTPRPDGAPKWLKCLVNLSVDQWSTIMEQLRTAFSNASSLVTFFIFLTLSPSLIGSVVEFFLINEVTGEQLALEQYDTDYYGLLRCPIGWDVEKWESVWKELGAARPKRINIWIRDGGFDEGLLDAASPGSSGQQQLQQQK